jgi:hypothetical protein
MGSFSLTIDRRDGFVLKDPLLQPGNRLPPAALYPHAVLSDEPACPAGKWRCAPVIEHFPCRRI